MIITKKSDVGVSSGWIRNSSSEEFLGEPRDDGLLVVLVDEERDDEEEEDVPDDENVRPVTFFALGEAFLPAVGVLVVVCLTRCTRT